MKIKTYVKALSALAQSSRLEIFKALVIAGDAGLAPNQLIEELEISPSALSFHLKELLNADLVSQDRVGRNLIYRAEFDRMNDLLIYLTDNCCQGAPCEVTATPCPKPKRKSIRESAKTS